MSISSLLGKTREQSTEVTISVVKITKSQIVNNVNINHQVPLGAKDGVSWTTTITTTATTTTGTKSSKDSMLTTIGKVMTAKDRNLISVKKLIIKHISIRRRIGSF